ncbi:hypothetical protein NDN08_002782 [Rhodosorus marinus]|uniref:Glucose/Sorbosone dehydrogenase domain-containing protein n=1 Tax=Rhodosorus marinus TaxID=101924 RepID=A0AAV8UUU8_9RHOD|nr:hypothetical protein NDN08_002782 [Rhodosorus marinus]
MRPVLFAMGLLVTAAAGASFYDESFSLEELSTNLTFPVGTCVVSGSQDKFLVIELGGLAWLFVNGTKLDTPFLNISSQIAVGHMRGLKACAFDSDFSNHRYLYLSYMMRPDQADPTGPTTGRVSKFRVNESFTGVTEETPILGRVKSNGCKGHDINAIEEDVICNDNKGHNLGGLLMDKQGHLYIGLADDGITDGAKDGWLDLMYVQTPGYLAGKILRVTRDGKAVEGNPYYSGNQTSLDDNASKVYSIGLHNPWRMFYSEAWDRIFVVNVGEAEFESVYALSPGKNIGWPCTQAIKNGEALDDYSVCQKIANEMDAGFNSLWDSTKEGSPGSSCITGALQVSNRSWPAEFQEAFLFADYCNDYIFLVDVDRTKLKKLDEPADFASGMGTIVDFREHPDGYVYVVTFFPGAVHRIKYDKKATDGKSKEVIGSCSISALNRFSFIS